MGSVNLTVRKVSDFILKPIDIGGISHTLIIEACYVGFPNTAPPYVLAK